MRHDRRRAGRAAPWGPKNGPTSGTLRELSRVLAGLSARARPSGHAGATLSGHVPGTRLRRGGAAVRAVDAAAARAAARIRLRLARPLAHRAQPAGHVRPSLVVLPQRFPDALA